MKKIKGDKNRLRMSVYRSNKHIYAQVIDDVNSKTVASFNSGQLKDKKGKGLDTALVVGEKLAAAAKKKGVKQVKFDRGKYKYHGRLKQLAEGARKGGLDF